MLHPKLRSTVIGTRYITVYRQPMKTRCILCQHRDGNSSLCTLIDISATNLLTNNPDFEEQAFCFFKGIVSMNPVPFDLCHYSVHALAKKRPLQLLTFLNEGRFVSIRKVCVTACELNLPGIIQFIVNEYPEYIEEMPYDTSVQFFSGFEYIGTPQQHRVWTLFFLRGKHPANNSVYSKRKLRLF